MNWIRNLKVAQKMMLLITLTALTMSIVGTINYYLMNEIKSNAEELYADKLLTVKWLNEIRTLQRDNEAKMQQAIWSTDEPTRLAYIQRVDENTGQIKDLQERYENTALDAFELEKIAEWKNQSKVYLAVRTRVLDFALREQKQAAYDLYIASARAFEQVSHTQQVLADHNSELANKLYGDIEAHAQQATLTMIGLNVLNIIIVGLLAMFLVREITVPLVGVQRQMNRAGAGDLTSRGEVRSTDEVGLLTASFNQMIRQQSDMVTTITRSADELAAASEQMAASTEEVSAAVSEIASTVYRIAEESEKGNQAVSESTEVLLELSSLIQIAKDKATKAAATSDTTAQAAHDGKRTVGETISSMEQIKEKAVETAEWMTTLNQYSQEIQQITETISNIASQTNLLALNAAIEAARAGEAGQGFAVVAEEVRKLAEQSNQGAVDVATLMRKVTENSTAALEATMQSRAVAEYGVRAVHNAGESLERILAAVNNTVAAVHDITQLTDEEVASSDRILHLIDSVSSVIENMNEQIQQVATSAEETTAAMDTIAAATEQTSAMASELRTSMTKFKTDDHQQVLSDVEILKRAKSDHLLWKLRIANMIDGLEQIDPESISTHTECNLGKWYFDTNNPLRDDSIFKHIDEPHAKVHALAKQAAQAYQTGNTAEAKRILGEIERNSQMVIADLDRLIRKKGGK
ncbi:methyl-accepting chemotaxis protein [Heliophilum fasciatum]|uniref:Methyl-accepting chemotaxis protein n=1 Tax=Heliophilum fasciatum TaxID=35700 RepID=A0A4R2S0I8_9FIRM|nr:methyl-accepting chemotaxis protein [Heliophilum fasciatum]MCW2276842.1 methyl-accepting chemotaxis protein [Heliophilum fasciatum]TCP68697.1 methyl-accepting chemotaxis protein [Heliophilum fasciatum]